LQDYTPATPWDYCIYDFSPANTQKRPFFEVEFLISLYRTTKGAWKIGDADRSHSTSSWPLKSTSTVTDTPAISQV